MARQSSRPNARRRKVGATVKVVDTAPRRKVHASRRAFLQLYAPKVTINPWKNATEWRASRPRFFAGVFLAVLVVALFQLFSAPAFFVDSITWTGNRFVSGDELTRASGIQGWSIFFLDTREVERTLLKRPEIKEAHVAFQLPNAVQVAVVERMPRFIWETGGATYWVDGEGIAFEARDNLDGLMWLKDLDNKPVQLGERVNPQAFNAAISLRNAWPDGPMVFEWSDAHGLAVRDQHGWPVYFGRASQMPEKVTALQIVTNQILKDNKRVTLIDLGSGLPYYQEAPQATKKP